MIFHAVIVTLAYSVYIVLGRFDVLEEELRSDLQTFMFKIIYYSPLPLDLRRYDILNVT